MIARILGSRITLGVCAVILAASAVVGRIDQADTSDLNEQSAEQECRSDLAAQFDDALFAKLERIERGLVAVSRGDDDALERVAELSDLARGSDTRIRKARADAVAVCSKENP